MNLRVRERALEDIKEIHDHLAQFSPAFAVTVVTAVFRALDILEKFPRYGVATDENNVHRWPMAEFRYTIFYTIVSDDCLDVLGRRVRDIRHLPR
jgi:plasmid stabilization system protein ParE